MIAQESLSAGNFENQYGTLARTVHKIDRNYQRRAKVVTKDPDSTKSSRIFESELNLPVRSVEFKII